MKVEVFSCSECGGPLKVAVSQFVVSCNYCGVLYHVKQKIPPAVSIKSSITLSDAKRIVLKELKDDIIAREFLHNSFFEKGTLFFIPFIEVRGIKSKETPLHNSNIVEFNYQAFDYIERGSDLNDLDIDFIESSLVEESLLNAEQKEFNLVEMRKSGVVLSMKNYTFFTNRERDAAESVIEKHYRIIYIPVWEINYSYKGIIFKSYVSAINGDPIKIQALKNHKKKLFYSILGLFSLGIIFSRGLKLLLFSSTAANLGIRGGGMFLLVLAGSGIAALFLFFLLFPFLWETFAFREIVSKRRDGVKSSSINYTENSFTKFGNRIVKRITSALGMVKIEINE
ncbi:MAG: hypothetical protein ABFR75_07730 [Acidobacteriota bacterium]